MLCICSLTHIRIYRCVYIILIWCILSFNSLQFVTFVFPSFYPGLAVYMYSSYLKFFEHCFLSSFCILANAHISQLQPSSATPPRGWNSYDSYSWVISEEEFLQNAELVAQKLLPFGYEVRNHDICIYIYITLLRRFT